MRKSQAIHQFWSSFGLKAYDEYTVPTGDGKTGDGKPDFPYITYSVSESAIDEPVSMTASVWYRSSSWTDIEVKTSEIAERIKTMNAIKIDDGYITIVGGVPFAQRMDDPSDDLVRRMIINVQVEYFTNY